MRLFTVVAALVASVAAYPPPNYNNPPTGNPIGTPGLNQIVPQGASFDITWKPTTPGPVSLVLLRGPSNNVKPIATIADGIPNSGHYVWNPVGYEPDTTHYGILLVDDKTLEYQYSTQFGMGPNPKNPSSSGVPSSTPTPSPSTPSSPVSSSVVLPTTTVSYVVTTTHCPECMHSTSVPLGTGSIPTTVSTKVPPVPTTVASGTPPSPTFTGAADRFTVSYGAGAVVAGLAAFLAL